MALPIPNAVDYLSPRIWTDFVQLLPRPDDLIGDSLLPRKDVAADRLMWAVLDSVNPMAPMVAVGTESPRKGGRQAQMAWADIIYSRWKRVLNEGDMRILRTLGQSPLGVLGPDIAGMRAASEDYVRNEAVELSEGIDRRVEFLQLSALQGKISIRPDAFSDLNYDITYDVVPVVPTGTNWDAVTTSDPLLDISTWFHGLRWKPARIVMNTLDLFLLQRNSKIHTLIFAGTPAGATTASIVTEGAIKQFLMGVFGLELITTRSVYTTYTNDGAQYTYTEHEYLPQGTLLILPAYAPGYTGEAPAQLNNYATGKFTFSQDPTNGGPIDPPETMLGCGWYGLPVINKPSQVLKATIWS